MSSIYKRNRIFWYKRYDPLLKKYHAESLKTADRRVAQMKRADLDAAYYHGSSTAEGSLTVAQALRAYVELTAARRSPHEQVNVACRAQRLIGTPH